MHPSDPFIDKFPSRQTQRNSKERRRKGNNESSELSVVQEGCQNGKCFIKDSQKTELEGVDSSSIVSNDRASEIQAIPQAKGVQFKQGTSQNHGKYLDPSIFFTFQRYVRPPPNKRHHNNLELKLQLPRFIPGRYVRATHRLYVPESVDVVDLMNHPDRFVDWGVVVKVDVLCGDTSELLMCPICLDSNFTAPRVSRCGHVFCFPCIMRALDEKFRATQERPKCPVCWEPLPITHLKPARFQTVKKPQIGNLVSFCLMTRESLASIPVLGGLEAFQHDELDATHTTTFKQQSHVSEYPAILPTSATRNSVSSVSVPSFLMSSNPLVYFYRLGCLNPSDAFLQEDLYSLESRRLEAVSLQDEPAVASIDDCIQSLLLQPQDSENKKSRFNATDPLPVRQCSQDTLISPEDCHSMFNFTYFDVDAVIRTLETWEPINACSGISLETPSTQNDNQQKTLVDPQLASDKLVCQNKVVFYQLSDGQLIILDELCMEVLLKDIANKRQKTLDFTGEQLSRAEGPFNPSIQANLLPSVLKDVRVEWIEEEIVNSTFRKRHPYLNFIPRGTSVFFCEAELSSVISAETSKEYQGVFLERKMRRESEQQWKAKIEDTRTARIEAMQTEQLQHHLFQQQQQRESSQPIDPVTGLLVQTITSDQSLFPPLDNNTSPSSSLGDQRTPIQHHSTMMLPSSSLHSNEWALRAAQSKFGFFPSLQQLAASSSHSPTIRAGKLKAKNNLHIIPKSRQDNRTPKQPVGGRIAIPALKQHLTGRSSYQSPMSEQAKGEEATKNLSRIGTADDEVDRGDTSRHYSGNWRGLDVALTKRFPPNSNRD